MKKPIPPVVLATCLGLMALIDWQCRTCLIPVILRPPWTYLGFILLLVAVIVGLAGLHEFRKAGTTIRPFQEPAKMVTEGIYRYTRNPMYLADVIGLLAAWVLMGMHSAILGVAMFVVIIDLWYIRGEEKMLSEKFGRQFEEFRSRTRRWI